jgi:hypothetical protein
MFGIYQSVAAKIIILRTEVDYAGSHSAAVILRYRYSRRQGRESLVGQLHFSESRLANWAKEAI